MLADAQTVQEFASVKVSCCMLLHQSLLHHMQGLPWRLTLSRTKDPVVLGALPTGTQPSRLLGRPAFVSSVYGSSSYGGPACTFRRAGSCHSGTTCNR